MVVFSTHRPLTPAAGDETLLHTTGPGFTQAIAGHRRPEQFAWATSAWYLLSIVTFTGVAAQPQHASLNNVQSELLLQLRSAAATSTGSVTFDVGGGGGGGGGLVMTFCRVQTPSDATPFRVFPETQVTFGGRVQAKVHVLVHTFALRFVYSVWYFACAVAFTAATPQQHASGTVTQSLLLRHDRSAVLTLKRRSFRAGGGGGGGGGGGVITDCRVHRDVESMPDAPAGETHVTFGGMTQSKVHTPVQVDAFSDDERF